jgi:predicted nucleotidyltransferase
MAAPGLEDYRCARIKKDKGLKGLVGMPPYNTQELTTIFAELVQGMPEIRLVYLFGSRLNERPGPLSDYDFAVLLDRAAAEPKLRASLAYSLARALNTSQFDIVLLDNAPIELAFRVISSGEILYELDVSSRVEYEARVMSLYFDYLPILRKEKRDILNGANYGARVQRYRKTFRRTQRTLGQIRALQG